MKVLHLIDSGGLYGAEKVLLTLVKEQIRLGLEPMILSAGSPDIADKAIEVEARRLGIPVTPWRMRPGLNLGETRKILAWARQEGYQLYHSHGYKFNILLGLARRSAGGVPHVTTLHGYVHARRFSKMWLYEVMDRWAIRKMDAVVLVGEPMRAELSGGSWRQRNVRVIPNGLDTEALKDNARLSLEPALEEFMQRRHPLVVGVGRLSREKGFDLLLDAFAKLKKDHPDAGLLIVGEGQQRADLEAQVKDLGVSGAVILPGYSNDIAALLHRADVLAMPSRTEGLPVTLLEAMAIGIPIVASAVGAISETLGSDKGGWVLDHPVAPVSLVHALHDAITGRARAESRVQWAQARVESDYSSRVMAERYREVYVGVMGQ